MRLNVSRFFWEIKVIDIDRFVAYSCMTMQGSRMIHSISSLFHMDSELLFVQQLTCFCLTCIDGGEEDNRDKIQHKEPWNTIQFVSTKSAVAKELQDDQDFDILASEDGQSLAGNIAQKDNFAIVANDPHGGERFFII